ncbi:MAG TPA: hypothetical protein PK640_08250 [Verrucomicrobiota bacterium]|nr:hypothetical protein [Verrucomicrobiota bacterium]
MTLIRKTSGGACACEADDPRLGVVEATTKPEAEAEARQGWAALIKQVYEANPLCCPKGGTTMHIVAFIERHETDVLERILRHRGLWEEGAARGPPGVEAVN